MLGHVRRVAARGRRAPQGLGHAADVMRGRAATQSEVADPESLGFPGEVRDLVAVTMTDSWFVPPASNRLFSYLTGVAEWRTVRMEGDEQKEVGIHEYRRDRDEK